MEIGQFLLELNGFNGTIFDSESRRNQLGELLSEPEYNCNRFSTLSSCTSNRLENARSEHEPICTRDSQEQLTTTDCSLHVGDSSEKSEWSMGVLRFGPY